jgi:hypothetical protein
MGTSSATEDPSVGVILVPWQYIPTIIQVGPLYSDPYLSIKRSDAHLCVPQNHMTFHRINGWVALAILFPATLFGTIVSRKAFGGDIADQAGFYSLGILTGLYAVEGMRTVHDIPRHRRWMLRAFSQSKT